VCYEKKAEFETAAAGLGSTTAEPEDLVFTNANESTLKPTIVLKFFVL